MKKSSNTVFYAVHVSIFLTAMLIILLGLKGILQEHVATLTEHSARTVKLLGKVFSFFVIGCVGSLAAIKFLKIKPQPQAQGKTATIVWGWVLYFVALAMLTLKGWAQNRFPLDQYDTVYYTLTNIHGGGYDKSILIEPLQTLTICIFIAALFFSCILTYTQKNHFFFVSIGTSRKLSIGSIYFMFGVLVLCATLFDTYRDLHIKKYISIIREYHTEPADSEFYCTEYVPPVLENIIFPSEKKNLIIILMESMESSFAATEDGGILQKNLIPHLTELASDNINFSGTDALGGGLDLTGTGWTIAAMTAKFAGLPFMLMGDGLQDRSFFLPGAVTLTDILAQNGYTQLFLFGSDKTFAGRDAFLETHGNVEIHDQEWYKEHGLLPQDYDVFWGFEDQKLFSFAKDELELLSGTGRPFMLGLLTVDTHMPEGWQCELCPDTEDMPFKNSVRCADTQVADFINWCKAQTWYKDTAIVILGDHLFMATEVTNPFGDDRYLRQNWSADGMNENPRRWIDIFINASPANGASAQAEKNRIFSSFDMFPTILSAIGCNIPGNRLGFGTDLFSKEQTLCERYSEQQINAALSGRNKQYDALQFPSTE